MSSKIQDLLKDKHDDLIDIDLIYEKYNWIFQENQNCIISPDSDGFISALLMSHYFNWKVKGFYDGKIMLYEKNVNPKDCIFLDMEIFSENVRSVGQHCIIPSNKVYFNELNLKAFSNCLSPGMLRNYDAWDHFRLKFPLGTIHFLISIIYHEKKLEINHTGLSSLLFVDGCFNVLFSYPENVLNWFKFLKIDCNENPLHNFFYQGDFSLSHVMELMDTYFKKRNTFGSNSRGDRGDHLIISNKNSTIENCTEINGVYKINSDQASRIQGFIKMNASNLGWQYKDDSWAWDNFNAEVFEKKMLGGDNPPSDRRYNLGNIRKIYQENLISNAVTASNRIEYSVSKNLDFLN